MPEKSPNVTVVVVVSGQPITVKSNINQRVDHLIDEALRDSGNKGQTDWELRTSDGLLLDPESRIGDTSIAEGSTLYLSPRAGAGGQD